METLFFVVVYAMAFFAAFGLSVAIGLTAQAIGIAQAIIFYGIIRVLQAIARK